MPNLTLRLSDELHAELVAAAEASGRSLQREIIVRLDGRAARAPVWVEGSVSSSGGLGAGERAGGGPPEEGASDVVTRPSAPAPRPLPVSAKELGSSGGKCPGYVPAGTRCKLCGKTH